MRQLQNPPTTHHRHSRGKHNMDRHEYLSTGARMYARRGEDLPQSKLDVETVAWIRRQHARKQRLIQRLNEQYSAAGMAERLGVHVRTVEKALRRESWAAVR
jgi:hypothetical protein